MLFRSTAITKPAGLNNTYGSSSGVRLVAGNSGVLNAGVLSSFQDNSTPAQSSLTASGLGRLALPNLSQAGILGVTLNGVTLPPTIVPVPVAAIARAPGSNIKISIQSLTGHAYQLQQTDSLAPSDWHDVGASQTGTNAPLEFVVPLSGPQRMFRIKITPWP